MTGFLLFYAIVSSFSVCSLGQNLSFAPYNPGGVDLQGIKVLSLDLYN